MNRILAALLLIIVTDPVHVTAQTSAESEPRSSRIDFIKDVQPILAAHCRECHAGASSESGLRLDRRRNAFAGGDQEIAIVRGNPEESAIIRRIKSSGEDRMPPEGEPLQASQIAVLELWIKQGAAWPAGIDPKDDPVDNHWSWQPLKTVAVPEVQDQAWPNNEIDLFILNGLEAGSIVPSAPATRELLIRRLFLDVIGLPPTLDEWRHWTELESPDWYEQLVDYLLDSPHYGEHWGRFWLDQARYADSDGYEKDQPRKNAYLYRDWVIDAWNSDLPFDQFSIQQLAGDLLPDATPKMISATGFHRNTLTNREGGIDKEEDRVKQTVDRLNTTFTVWMGLTLQCAQCHSHKYDPISQREYFQLYSFFNDADESTVTLEATARQTEEFREASKRHKHEIAGKSRLLQAAQQRVKDDMNRLVIELTERFPDGATGPSRRGLIGHYPFENEPDSTLANQGSLNNRLPSARFFGPGQLLLVEGRKTDSPSNRAIVFDGSGQHLDLPGLPSFGSQQSFTCATWIKPEDNLGGILTKIDEPNHFRGIDFTNNKGLLEVHLVDRWPENAIKVTPVSARLKNEEWQHVAFSYDGSRKASGVTMYLDGQQVELKIHFDTLTGDFTTDDPWRIGRRKTGTFLKGTIDDVQIYDRVLAPAEISLLADQGAELKTALVLANRDASKRTEEENVALLEFFLKADRETSSIQTELANLKANPPTVVRDSAMILKQRDKPRSTHVHVRGDFLNKGVPVQIGTPSFLPPLKARGSRPDRLDLARWMFDPANGLPPRVFVNRIWQAYFGRGLVESDSDLGTQGDRPTHPELLDWLATAFVKSGWKIKNLHRRILLSATYRQTSKYRPELEQLDPGNTLVARQQRMRVSAETVRDLALSAGGLLNRQLKGPSVFPPLPAGVIELAFVDVINRGPWKESSGVNRYRRGLYTFFQRTSPYPMLVLFDAPDSNVTCTRREKSNTPLQALTLWNDSVFTECARELAASLIRFRGTEEERIERAFITCLARRPFPRELEVSKRLVEKSRLLYEQDRSLAQTARGSLKLAADTRDSEFGAWFALTRALMNLDEFISRQ